MTEPGARDMTEIDKLIDQAKTILDNPEEHVFRPLIMLKLTVDLAERVVALERLMATHRHGYRWEPTEFTGEPLSDEFTIADHGPGPAQSVVVPFKSFCDKPVAGGGKCPMVKGHEGPCR